MSLYKTFQEMYLCGLLIPFNFAGIQYLMGKLELPGNKFLSLGVAGNYNQNFIFQIIKTLENSLPTRVGLHKLSDSGKEYSVLQYETEKNQKFLIIKDKDEAALTPEEIDYLWQLL